MSYELGKVSAEQRQDNMSDISFKVLFVTAIDKTLITSYGYYMKRFICCFPLSFEHDILVYPKHTGPKQEFPLWKT